MKLKSTAADHAEVCRAQGGVCNQCGKDHYTCDVCGVEVVLSPGEILDWRARHAAHTSHDPGEVDK